MSEFKIPAADKPGWICPACSGTGRNQDGKLSMSPSGSSFVSATTCGVCRGKGRVRVFPLVDAYGFLEKDE